MVIGMTTLKTYLAVDATKVFCMTNFGLVKTSLIFLALLTIWLVGCYVRDEPSGWQVIGRGFSDGDFEHRPSMTVATNNHIYLSGVRDDLGGIKAFVSYWNGRKWRELAETIPGGGSSNPVIALSSHEQPHVVLGSTNVWSWVNHEWQKERAAAQIGRGSTLTVASDDHLYLAWEEQKNSNWEIYLVRGNGQVWEEVGGSLTGGGISNTEGSSGNPSVAVAQDGTIYVAWVEFAINEGEVDENSHIHVKRWNGNDWEETDIGSASRKDIKQTQCRSLYPMVVMGPKDIPFVIWANSCGNYFEIIVERWSGQKWVTIGTEPVASGIEPYFSVKQPQIAIGFDGTSYVAWSEDVNGNNEEIYVKRWDGTRWEGVSTDSTRSGNVSKSDGDSIRPSLTIRPDGIPCVAWEEHTSYIVRRPTSIVLINKWPRVLWDEEEKTKVEIIVSCFKG